MRILIVILLYDMTRKELLHASSIHQCLTWDLYDDKNIRFICRVSNFVKPITLTDNHGKLFAQCTFFEKVQSCQPSRVNSFVRVNYSTNEVIFYVNRGSIWLYDGDWSCHVGREIFLSSVSISRGIVNDTTVQLESSIKNTNTIELKCSSCKVPISFNAEFQINGISAENIFYDRRSSKCIRGGVSCTPDVCGCSASGNEYSIQLNTNTLIHKSFACDLMFSDPVTTAKFSKIAEITFNGTDYIPTKTKTKIIKPGTPRVDKRVSFFPDNIVTPVTDHKVNYTVVNAANNRQNKKAHPLQWIVLGILLVLIIVLAVYHNKRRWPYCLRKRICNLPTIRFENKSKDLAETSPFINEEADNTCRFSEVYEPTDQKGINEVSILKKDDIRTKSRITFKSKDRESSFYMRKTVTHRFASTV